MTAYWIGQGSGLTPTPESSGTAITVPVPSGYQEGDILILVATTANQNFPTTPPSGGWADVPNPPVGFGTAGSAGGLKLFVWWKRAGASESSVSLGDSGSYNIGVMYAIRDADESASPFEATVTQNITTAATTVPAIPASATFSAPEGGLALLFVAGDLDTSTSLSATTNGTSGTFARTDILGSTATTTGAGGGLWGRAWRRDTSGTTTFTAGVLNGSQTSSGWFGIIKSRGSLIQSNWRFRNDNGSETAATWIANAGVDASTTISADELRRVRFALTSVASRINVRPVLQFATSINNSSRLDATKYVEVATSANAKSINYNVLFVAADGMSIWHGVATSIFAGKYVGTIGRYDLPAQYDLSSVSTTPNYTYDLANILGDTSSDLVSRYNGMYVKADNTKIFLIRDGIIYQSALSGTKAQTGSWTSITVDSGSPICGGLWFKPDGTKVFWTRANNPGVLCSRDLSTAWDITTATGATTTKTLSTLATSLVFRDDGTRAWIEGYQYNFSTAWDVSTALFVGTYEYLDFKPAISDNCSNAFAFSNSKFTRWECDFFNWTDVTTSTSPVQAADSPNVTNAANTTQQITTGTFITPNSGISETGTAGTADDIDFTATASVEVEYVVKLIYSALTSGDILRFRIKTVDSRTLR